MTGTYAWNPMPHRVSVRCPACAQHASFEFAETVRIKRKADIPFFEKSRLFEYAFIEVSRAGQNFNAALFYAGLHGGSTAAIRELPDGYSPEDWDHSRYLYRSWPTDRGSVVCPSCRLHRKHVLRWPEDAWFQVEYRGSTLWAFERESATVLRDHIASTERRLRRRRRWSSLLLHVPKEFLVASARATLVKRLDRLLGA